LKIFTNSVSLKPTNLSDLADLGVSAIRTKWEEPSLDIKEYA
jgi:hypothetical protein